MRAHLAEFGIVAPVGRNGVEHLLNIVADFSDKRLPDVARACVTALGAQLRMLKAQILEFDRQIMAWHRSNEASKRLDEIPGVGPVVGNFPVLCDFVTLRDRYPLELPREISGASSMARFA